MMQIEQATQADKAAWWPLWQAYLTFYNHPLPDEISDLTFARCLDPEEPMQLLLAREDGVTLGFVTLVFHRSTWARTTYCYLEDLYVDERARGKGVGRALIEAVSDIARTQGAERLYWNTDFANTTAQALYNTLAEKTDFLVYRRILD
ncbi:GNAT family N-acetyltransferase [Asticcacaulis sp. 201]|uniref:GNAT family N-acetyltransferase n=1 Tax=Asticcacaulis sp. 201 TaxID=3028787 RepID=UPI00291612CD|nr:GNAT family N-acetyltransferase [Asticcacaulis sp. 201]MDV6329848.1 GNAT family N-acetyltransferase [Asticcacaulis sp. 201]